VVDRARLDRTTAHLEPPFAVVDLGAFDANAADMVRRAAGTPIRVASKSVRCRTLIDRALASPGFAGVLAFTLSEGLWLAENGIADVVVGYPTADRRALGRLAADDELRSRVTLMVDDVAHLDYIAKAVGPDRPPIRVCIELDASWRPLGLLHLGTRRSPVHTAEQAIAFARAVTGRPGFRLVGLMAYEAQVAGLGNAPRGRALRGALIRLMQSRSMSELVERRAAAVAAIREITPLEFVNGGGTGSLERTSADSSVTEIAAGSGLFGPALFDTYRHFTPRPAAMFAQPVVRLPAPGVVTVLGGGYVASGPIGADRLPQPYLPAGLKMLKAEGAGEVQTPLAGAHELRIGDRVWFRHAKAGELCERFDELHLVDGDRVVATAPTYRGEGYAFC
jgi:D-serine deaminase-like pyridoxal phosphate-dependent protein